MHSFGHKKQIYHVSQVVVRFATLKSAMSLVLSKNDTTGNATRNIRLRRSYRYGMNLRPSSPPTCASIQAQGVGHDHARDFACTFPARCLAFDE